MAYTRKVEEQVVRAILAAHDITAEPNDKAISIVEDYGDARYESALATAEQCY